MSTSDLPAIEPGYNLGIAPQTAFVFLCVEDGWVPIARVDLELVREGRQEAVFSYGRGWLNQRDRFPIDPVNLPLIEREVRQRGMIGVLRDAMPDRWGRVLFEQRFNAALEQQGGGVSGGGVSGGGLAGSPSKGALGIAGQPFRRRLPNDIDQLFLGGDDRVGALAFGPDVAHPLLHPSTVPILRIEELRDVLLRIDAGEKVDTAVRHLGAGTSLGGGRPKGTVRKPDSSQWLAKFHRASDTYDVERAEYVAMRLAALAGVRAAETELLEIGGRAALLVRRFDREHREGRDIRLPYISGLALCGLTESDDGGSYLVLADKLRQAGSPEELAELYRRMLFNIACGNTDDHLKNQGLIYIGGKWRLAPAFDIVPQLQALDMQALSVGTLGPTSTLENALTACGRFGLSRDRALAIAGEVMSATTQWHRIAIESGLKQGDLERLAACFERLGPVASQSLEKKPAP